MHRVGRSRLKVILFQVTRCELRKSLTASHKPAATQASGTKAETASPNNTVIEKKLEDIKQTKKTIAQLDEEMRQAMEGISGDGGVHGIEYEDGKPVAMKRAVKENMFRLI